MIWPLFFYDLTTVRIHGEGAVEDDIRAFGMNKERGGIARQFVLGIVQTADGLPLMHTVHPGNVAETKTLQAMLKTVLQRFPIDRVILVADRGLLSFDNIHHLTEMANQGGRKLEFILAVPARRYGELTGTFRELNFDEEGLAEAQFADHRLIVAHDPLRAAEQSDKRRARIAELEAMAEKMVTKLDAQDDGKTAQGRRASDRGAYSRFTRAVAEAEMLRFVKPDLTADRFSWSIDEDAIADAQLFDGKLALITNAPDLTPTEAVERYRSLADIERGFRVLKSDIEIAPVHHRLPDRIRAHALICFMALTLYRVMRIRLKAQRHTASPSTALNLLARIQKHTAHIGDRTFNGTSKTTQEQLDLFEAMGLKKARLTGSVVTQTQFPCEQYQSLTRLTVEPGNPVQAGVERIEIGAGVHQRGKGMNAVVRPDAGEADLTDAGRIAAGGFHVQCDKAEIPVLYVEADHITSSFGRPRTISMVRRLTVMTRWNSSSG